MKKTIVFVMIGLILTGCSSVANKGEKICTIKSDAIDVSIVLSYNNDKVEQEVIKQTLDFTNSENVIDIKEIVKTFENEYDDVVGITNDVVVEGKIIKRTVTIDYAKLDTEDTGITASLTGYNNTIDESIRLLEESKFTCE